MDKLDKNIRRKMSRKTRKKSKNFQNFSKTFEIFNVLVHKMNLKTPKTSFICLKLEFKVLS